MLAGLDKKWAAFKTLLLSKALVATVAAHFNSVSVGMCQGYSAILLPQLEEVGAKIEADEDELSWIASLGVITNPLGALLAGVLMECWGRKTAVQLISLPFLLGWIIIALSQNLFILCIGRAITGVALGMGAACYVYVAEISPPSERGFLSAFGPVFVSLGVLLVYSFGYLFSWEIAAALCAVTAALSALLMAFVPESPSWLLSRQMEKKARQAIIWLRGDNDQAAKELADLSEAKTVSNEEEGGQLWKRFCQPSVWKPLVILLVFFLLQEGSGLYVILYYAVDFLKESGSTIDQYVMTIIIASGRLVMSIVGTVLIKRFNRRTMACASGVGMAITWGVVGTYEYMYHSTVLDERPLAWLPQLCIIANVCASMLGMLQLPWVMTGELFPTSVRGIMGGVVSSLAYLFIFGVVKVYPSCLHLLQLYGMMWLFAVMSMLVIVFALVWLPETQNRSLIEIEEKFKGKKSRKPVEMNGTDNAAYTP